VAHEKGPQLRVGFAGHTNARSIETVMATLGIPWHEVQADPDLVNHVVIADNARAVPVIIVDETSVVSEPFATVVQRLDAGSVPPLAVLVGTDSRTPDDKHARDLFPTLGASGRHLIAAFSIHDTKALEDKLTQMIFKLRLARIEADAPARVDDAALTAAAEQAGISILTRPSLHGPGGAIASLGGAGL
jgi:hypothetical protein